MGAIDPHDTAPGLRLDKWLWAARFFKTRVLAATAITNGKVQVNGVRAKPARILRLGDRLEITLPLTPDAVVYEVMVCALSDRRGPALQAAQLYQETPASLHARALQMAQQRERVVLAPAGPAHRPSKQERRRIVRFTRKGE